MEQLAPRELLAADLLGLQLQQDTGHSASDGITAEGTVTASVEWDSPLTTHATIEFDHDEDGLADGTQSAQESGDALVYDPVAADAVLTDWEGSLPLRYRIIEHRLMNDQVGAWTDFTFTLDRVAPQVAWFEFAAGDILNAPAATQITFDETIDPASLGGGQLQVAEAECTTIAQSSSAVGDTVSISFDAGPLAPSSYTTTAAGIRDLAGNIMEEEQTVEWHVNAAPNTTGIEDIDDMSVTELALDSYFADDFDAADALAYTIESNDNSAAASTTIEAGGQLLIDYAPNATGNATIVVRATDSGGQWAETGFTILMSNMAPEIINFVGIETPSLWTFEGQVVDESPLGMTVTFGGVLAGHSTTITDPEGYFWYGTDDIANSGTATAETEDSAGLVSNLAETHVRPTT